MAIYKKIAGSEQNSLFAVLRAQQIKNEELQTENANLTGLEDQITELTTERDRLTSLNEQLKAKLLKYRNPISSSVNWQQLLNSTQKQLTDSATVTIADLQDRLVTLEAALHEAATEYTSLLAQIDLLENDLEKERIEHQFAKQQNETAANLYESYKAKYDTMVNRVKESEFHYIQLNKVKTNLDLDLDSERKKNALLAQQFTDYRATVENLGTVWSKINFELPLNPFFYLKWGLLLLTLFFVLTIIRWLSSFWKPASKPRYYR